ncbi:heparan sulfate 2-O-sulfotransferase [Teladorsagia circumcincta]|uniref:Heparan sulfate 2-O-sulfotransferase n=1 Tax=Teladorsagia circumcincta TaxID=45464 RepID=A0A2G9UQR2_TELCI|nr:heparan sulfate 2-O-sulfotransferase [Teladorsagia circumcincta]
MYNRVPKTGSTTFTNAVAYDLFKLNNFNVIHLNMTKNRQIMSLTDQSEFIENITSWKERLPAFYHGHVAFIDFERFGRPNPIYINIVREPLERLLSHYYFLRFGDNYRIGLKRSRAGNNEVCVESLICLVVSSFYWCDKNRAHLRYTKRKYPPNDQTLSIIRRNEVYQLEKEFYDFAKEEFQAIFKKATNGTNNASDILRLKSQYHYEKIKPERPFNS